jgi:primosomal protein N' (replication factor Y)
VGAAGQARGAEVGAEPVTARVVPDVRTLSKSFDYLVPEPLRDQVRVGTLVRIPLQGRRVGGWVVEVGSMPPDGVALKPLGKVTGWGPPAELVDVAQWAAWRWAGPVTAFLGTASPPGAVLGLPVAPHRDGRPAPLDPSWSTLFEADRSVVRVPPAADLFDLVLAAVGGGNALVVTPSVDLARQLGARLRRAGVPVGLYPRDWALGAAGATVVGARAAAWAPVADLAAVLVLDEHDEALQEERAPTWHGRDVAIERARRAGVPCVLASPVPTLEALAWGPLVTPSRTDERAGWPVLEIVDRRQDDPARPTLLSAALTHHLRSEARVVCVLNTPGRARLLACVACGELARCERCAAAVEQLDDGRLHCRRCGTERPLVCLVCGASRMKAIRPGVARLRGEIEALIGSPVVMATAATAGQPLPEGRVHIGTEAVLHQVEAADVVAFLDIDQELLAPRYRAAEQALALLARAARLTGGRAGGGRLLVQTRVPRHEVLDAVLHADPSRLAASEQRRREALRFPPYSALAVVSGPAAEAFLAALGEPLGIEVLGPADGRWLLRAPDHPTLCDALAAVPRPPGRLRLEIDPRRV